MELWIRSQDKSTLSKITEISFDNDFIMGKNDNQVYAYLGQYNSKERCLEILDEVQKILTRTGTFVFENVEPPQSKEELDALKKKIDKDGMVFLFSEFGNKAECKLLPAPVVIYQMPEE